MVGSNLCASFCHFVIVVYNLFTDKTLLYLVGGCYYLLHCYKTHFFH
uniref:Uncharacterized protein n=1 Tax=Triticum urartu TaxID=4572 RepID=A0A8R7Q2C8_TRIUA